MTTQGTISQYQCGFTRGKSTPDANHNIKQILEIAYEHIMKMEILFIDFRQNFDSIKRDPQILAMK